MAAGANEIENVEWLAADPKQLETKAYAAAIKRAHELAEQTASQTGLKLGEIIFIMNSKSSVDRLSRLYLATSSASIAAIRKMPMLRLHPGTVEREASVTVTYAVAQ